MKSHQSPNEEQEKNPTFHWWRSLAESDEFVNNSVLHISNLSKITPTFKVIRDMERLASVASEGLRELRHKLLVYRAGDLWVPIGGLKKEDVDIPQVNTILLVGFGRAGKSSLVNLMYSVLGRSGLITFAQTSSGSTYPIPTSLFMEEHNVLRSTRNGFCVYDTRGFDHDHVEEAFEELSEWMVDGVHHYQLCSRPGDHNLLPNIDELEVQYSTRFARRRVNCVMVVVNVAEINRAMEVSDMKPLEALKLLFQFPAIRRSSNENPILILTHGDKLSAGDRIRVRVKICEFLGISESTGTYDIVCTTEYGFLADEIDPITAYALSEAVYKALIISDKGHIPKRKFQDWALLVLSWFMCCIAQIFLFFGRLLLRISS